MKVPLILMAIVMVSGCSTVEERDARNNAWKYSLQEWHGKPLYTYIQHSNMGPVKSIEAGENRLAIFALEHRGQTCSWNFMVDSKGTILSSAEGNSCDMRCPDLKCQYEELSERADKVVDQETIAKTATACAAAGGTMGGSRCYPAFKPTTVEMLPMPTINTGNSITCTSMGDYTTCR